MSSRWWEQVYGDPCRQCGVVWVVSFEDAVADVAAVPALMRDALRGVDGAVRHPDLGWSSTGYVVHVADTLRVWAERVAGALAGDEVPVAGFDAEGVAAARGYDGFGKQAALWSLRRAVGDWCEVVRSAHLEGVGVQHPSRGRLDALDVALRNRHGALHHVWDVRHIVGQQHR